MSVTTGTNTTWALDLGDDLMQVNGVLTGVGGRTKGETYDYSLVFRDAMRSEGGRSATECFNDVLERGTYAGRFEVHEMLDGPPEYTPTWPTGEPTLLVNLEPVDSTTVPVPGIWGLIDAVEVGTAPITTGEAAGQAPIIDLSLTHLANSDDYVSREAIVEDLEHAGLY